MKKHKYVRKEYGFIIFPETFNHSDFGHKGNVISAGFCQIDTELQECFCFGESISIGVKSLPEDSAKMKKQFFEYY
jgi:hypothetical protein